jgi:predicted transcriptional regulator
MTAFSFQVVAARGLLGWSPQDLADAAGVSLSAVKRIEKTAGDLDPKSKSLQAVGMALASRGVVFTRDLSRIGVALDTRRR